MKFYTQANLLFLVLIQFLCLPAFAQPQHFPAVDILGGTATLWRITDYDDTSNTHPLWATQDICFIQGAVQGSNTTGLWYSTTYNRWLGRYRQEGDQVTMIGDFWKGQGNDVMKWEITVNDTEGFGHWEEWVEDGAYGNWVVKANAKLVRVGTCAWQPPVGIALPELERLVIQQADFAPIRVRTDGALAIPSDPKLAPIIK
jgi:hypothetical protein